MTAAVAWTTPDLCDAHADLRVLDAGFVDFGGREAFGGPVATVRCPDDNSPVRRLVAEPGNGRVLVVAGDGVTDYALLGDRLARNAVDHGWAGIVVDGAVRDVPILRTLDLGIRARASHPIRTEKRGRGAAGLVVRLGGITIRPGEWLYADATGIVVADRPLV